MHAIKGHYSEHAVCTDSFIGSTWASHSILDIRLWRTILSCILLGSGLSKSPLASCDASSPLACDASPLACDAWVRVLHLSLADACSLIMATEKLTGWPVYIDIFHGHTHPPRCNIHRAVVEISQGFHCTFHV